MKTVNEITNKIKYEYINKFINSVRLMIPIDDLINFDTKNITMFSLYGNTKKPNDYYVYVGKDQNNYMYFLNYIAFFQNNCVEFINSKFKFCYLIPYDFLKDFANSNIYSPKTQVFPGSSEFELSLYQIFKAEQFEEYLRKHQK